jgi:hypothetical protein
LEILCEFPKQVIALKPTGIICQLKGRRCGFTRRMISKDETRGFPGWCEGLAKARAGGKNLERQILEAGKEADAQLKRMLDAQETYGANLEEESKSYTDAELKALRARSPMSLDIFDKIFGKILNRARLLIEAHANIAALPPARELPYTFIFRYALAGYMLDLRWIGVGGAKNVKAGRIRNDIVDATLAAYATYFQGLLSDDAKAKEVYDDAKAFLKVVLAYPPPPDHVAARKTAKSAAYSP